MNKFMKKNLLYMIILVVFYMLAGCKSYTAYVYSAVDPEYKIERTDQIWLTLPAESSIRERQLFVILKSELQKNKFIVVDRKESAKYVLALSAERNTYDYGTTSYSSIVAIPNSSVSFVSTNTQRNIVDRTTIYLYLFNVNDFNNGKYMRIWEGSVSATQNVLNLYKTAMFKNLLDVYGKDFERPTKLSRSYIKEDK